MKTKLYLLFFFVFPLFMSACRGDDPIPDPPVDGKRTVLVYMAADNSINPLASFTDVWGIERSGFFNGREKWAKGFENQRV